MASAQISIFDAQSPEDRFIAAVDNVRAQAQELWPDDWAQILALGFQQHDTPRYFTDRLTGQHINGSPLGQQA